MELLFTCPRCEKPNFTKKGLRSHVCRKNNRKPLPEPEWRAVIDGGGQKALAAVVGAIDEAQEAEMGAQLTEQYGKAVNAMPEVLKFGAMMMRLREHLSQNQRGFGKLPSGSSAQDGGVKGWLAKHAPKVKLTTAKRFESVTMGVADDYVKIVGAKTAKQFALPALVTTPAAELPEPVRKKQAALFDYVAGTSQRSWLDKFKTSGPGGNQHPKCPHCHGDLKSKRQATCPHCGKATGEAELTPEEQLEALRITLEEWAADHLTCDRIERRLWRVLPATTLQALLGHFKRSAEEMQEYIRTPARQREALTLEELAN